MEKKNQKPNYQTRTRNVQGHIRAAGNENEPIIEAYFVVFGDKYEFSPGCYETIDPAAFDGQLAGDVRALADHDSRIVLGRTTAGTLQLKADGHGLWGQIRINPEDTEAMNVYSRVKRGDVTNCSFGFEILNEKQEQDPDGAWHWTVLRVKLWEVSVVTFPAYEDTVAAARSVENKEFRSRQIERIKAETLAKLKRGKPVPEPKTEIMTAKAERKGESAMIIKQRSIYNRLASSTLVREYFTEKQAFGDMPTELSDALENELQKLSPLYRKIRLLDRGSEYANVTLVSIKKLEDPSEAWTNCGEAPINLTDENNVRVIGEISGFRIGAYAEICSEVIRKFSAAAIELFVLALARSLVPSLEEAILRGDGKQKPTGILATIKEENKHTSGKTGAELYSDLITFGTAADPELYAGPWEFSAIANRKTLMRLLNTIGSTETQTPAYLPQLMAEVTPCESMKDGELLLGYLPTYFLFTSKALKVTASEHMKFIDDQIVYLADGRYDGMPIVNGAFVHVKMTSLGAAE